MGNIAIALAATVSNLAVGVIYRPESWVPHVTLAISDTREGDVARVASELREVVLERPLVVRTLAMLHQDGPTYRVLRPHPLG